MDDAFPWGHPTPIYQMFVGFDGCALGSNAGPAKFRWQLNGTKIQRKHVFLMGVWGFSYLEEVKND